MNLWLDGRHDPVENMRRDALLLAAAEAGAEPVLRLFEFAPPGITLGRVQDPDRELDLERCAADGVPWAIRPTGGRAIFHAQEWTYALATPRDDPEWGGAPADLYRRISDLLARSLRRLGVPAVLAPGSRRSPLAPRAQDGAAPPCFASTARHEVALEGRKLIGSAQRRTAAALLQQGSLLLGEGHLRLADYLAVPASRREAIRGALRLSTAHAGGQLGPDPPLSMWSEALLAELPPGVRRREGAVGAKLLTLAETGSYTPSPLQTER